MSSSILRYTLVVKPVVNEFIKELNNVGRLDCKSLIEAKEWYGILTESERKKSYIWDNIKECRVEI